MSTGLELRTRHQSNLLSTCSLVSVRPRVATALEDKILQRAVVEVLNAIYETDFVGFSYGFRPGRKPHDALDALATGILRRRVKLGARRGFPRLLLKPRPSVACEDA